MHTITLSHAALCLRCGAAIPEGARARWHSVSKLVRHFRACPKPVVRQARRRRSRE
jgi:hypothetical protein